MAVAVVTAAVVTAAVAVAVVTVAGGGRGGVGRRAWRVAIRRDPRAAAYNSDVTVM